MIHAWHAPSACRTPVYGSAAADSAYDDRFGEHQLRVASAVAPSAVITEHEGMDHLRTSRARLIRETQEMRGARGFTCGLRPAVDL